MPIKTFIFLDLETTGLPSKDIVPKITELAMFCVLRSDIEKANVNNLPPVSKLTFLFNPQMKLSSEAAKITGLSNEFLVNQPIFRDKIKCITEFLDAPKPVCLIAHNGVRFDFKIIKYEFENAKVALPRELYCVDSLKAFKEILKENQKDSKEQIFDTSDDTLDEEAWPDLNVTPEDWLEIDNVIDSFANLSCSANDSKKTPTKSFKLIDIYKTSLKKDPIGSHRAEADCMMLLECVVSTKQYFLPWADKNYKLLSAIKPFKSAA